MRDNRLTQRPTRDTPKIVLVSADIVSGGGGGVIKTKGGERKDGGNNELYFAVQVQLPRRTVFRSLVSYLLMMKSARELCDLLASQLRSVIRFFCMAWYYIVVSGISLGPYLAEISTLAERGITLRSVISIP